MHAKGKPAAAAALLDLKIKTISLDKMGFYTRH